MRTSIWYRAEERQPPKSGYYLSYRGWGMGGKGDGDHDHGYLYYHTKYKKWYEYEGSWNSMFPDEVSFVYYWTDADPRGWTDEDLPSIKIKALKESNPAVQSAWDAVQEAIRQYEFIKKLTE